MAAIEYRDLHVALRPPRVAVFFRADDHWMFRAAAAIRQACRYWGGRGFIMVPYSPRGEVSLLWADVLRAYDPDYLAIAETSLQEAEALEPGSVPIQIDGRRAGKKKRKDLIASTSFFLQDRAAKVATDWASSFTSAYERTLFTGTARMAETIRLIDSVAGSLTSIDVFGDRDKTVGESSAGSADRLIAGSVMGLNPDSDLELDRSTLQPRRLAEIFRAQVESSQRSSGERPDAWRACDVGLTKVSSGPGRAAGVLVFGDSADDFAYAYAMQRMLGIGIWLPQRVMSLINLKSSKWIMGLAVDSIRNIGRDGEPLSVFSSRLTRRQLENRLEKLDRSSIFIDSETPTFAATLSWSIPDLGRGASYLALEDQFDEIETVAMSLSDGWLEMLSPLSAQPARPPGVAGIVGLAWHVDVGLRSEIAPSRLAPPTGMAIDDRPNGFSETVVRRSNHGYSFRPFRNGLVLGGESFQSRSARPKFRFPDLETAIIARALESGFEAARSSAGVAAVSAADLVGGRQQLIELFGRPIARSFRSFKVRNGMRTADAFPSGHGVAIGELGYLDSVGLAEFAGLSANDARVAIDALTTQRVLRRGLILQCRWCKQIAFYPPRDIDTTFRCSRCGEEAPVMKSAWRQPDEPTWFYDLNSRVRQLFVHSGDAVLLLAAHLKGDRRNYADVPELAFRREGAISAEIDLFAYASRELVAGEVTTNETFGDGKQTVRSLFRKKAAVVEAIGVSKLIFATTQRQFAQGQVSELAAAARSSDLEVSLITGLGGGIVLDAVLERAW